jgi:predicted TIM-barrel fold metal-dependent hydrolase
MTTGTLNSSEGLPEILSRTVDVDSHEMAPTHVWGELFGPNTAKLAIAGERLFSNMGVNTLAVPGLTDTADISFESVWNVRGPSAPGSFNFERRLEVMDEMGTERQLVYPTAALTAFMILAGGDPTDHPFQIPGEDPAEMLRGAVSEYNEWALRTTNQHPDRYRAAVLIAAHDVDTLVREATDLIERGAKAIWLPTAAPPAGRSPADPDLDPFWNLASKARVAVTLHIGTETGFRATETWRHAPAFAAGKVESTEILLEPFSATTQHLAAENYLTAIVLGGVFERHPELRFGVIEQGAGWFGPLAERLDIWVTHIFSKRMSQVLTLKPSEYLSRNVRVTPYYFEPIGLYLERYPHLQDCYCYSTDYPHNEGGRQARDRYYEGIRHLGDQVVGKFFAENGEWLVPA